MWLRFVAWTLRTEVGTSLALFRIAMGLCVVLDVWMVARVGLVDALWVDASHGGIATLHPDHLVSALGGATPGVMRGLSIATVAAGLMVAVGVGGRVMAFVCLQLTLACVDINHLAGGSYDELLENGLWLCVLGDTTRTLSLDCRLRTGAWSSSEPVAVWARYLIVLQLVVMYTSTGWQKLSSYWTPGGDFSALYYILQQPTWHRFDMRWLAAPGLFQLTQLGTAVSWFWEVFAPVWLLAFHASATPGALGRLGAWLLRWRVKEVYAMLGLMFHVVVAALMEVGPFSPISMAFYLALVGPDAWDALWRRLTPRRREAVVVESMA